MDKDYTHLSNVTFKIHESKKPAGMYRYRFDLMTFQMEYEKKPCWLKRKIVKWLVDWDWVDEE